VGHVRYVSVSRVFAVLAAAGACVLAILPAGTSLADGSATLPITSFDQMAIDTAHGHIFFSQGSASENSILVTTLTGQTVTTIPSQDGVMGVALSADGSTLYAALSSSDEVSAISTATLQQTATFPLPSGDSPQNVAVQSGKVWVSYTTSTPQTAAIGDIDLTASTPAFETQSTMGGFSEAPELAADPSNSGVLVALAVDAYDSTGSIASYNTTTDPATVLTQSGWPGDDCGNTGGLAVVPGGADYILSCSSQYQAAGVFSTTDGSQQATYAANYFPDGIALDSSGDVAIGTEAVNNGGVPGPDLYVYRAGGSTALNELNVNVPYNGTLVSGGLAWAPDGSQLFAVIDANTTGAPAYSLQTVSAPTITRSSLTLTGPSTAYITHAVTLTGNLSLSTGTMPAGTQIAVTRSQSGSTATKNFTVSTTSTGSFQLTDTPPAAGDYKYTAAFAGTSAITPATVTQAVNVLKLPTTLSISASRTVVSYNSTVHLTIRLGTTATSRTVQVYAHDLSKPRAALLRKASIGRNKTLAISYRASHTTEFSVVFAGDAQYAARTVTRTVTVKVNVSEHLSGYYGTRGKYHLFSSGSALYAHAAVSPNKRGQCVMFEVQEYFQGSWQEVNDFNCIKLSSSSNVTGKFGLSQADRGVPYRIRADFSHKASDRSNANNDSAWVYLEIE
jgi:YVTN family beta-propeller protein